ncbi:homeobox protein PKNOX1 [Aplysia californica]|uniref:Homeobox protein PKNOX1 n=1 Tax=Aplysia californica TaxID=6500 RepID=A0ABM1A4R5_APLCA|nr:homeobox protein PKNOX1 [Aplysia californica]
MSIIQQGLPPPYSDPQGMVGVTEASMQQSFLTLASQDSTVPTTIHTELVHPVTDAGENQDAFKQSIYRHPLFPLLALMFEKCESATASPDTASHGFENELQAFAKHHDHLKTPVLGADEEVNELMLKAIQVLRIHLMEVEKVTELCRDFCSRYISCLKSKLTSESLLHVEGCDSPPPGELAGSQGVLNLSPALQVPQPVVAPTVVGGSVVLQQQQQQQQPQQPPQAPQQPQIVSGNTVYQMVHTPQGIVAQPIQIQGPLTPISQAMPQVIHGSTPLSQIGLSLASPQQQQQQQQSQQLQQSQQQAVQTAMTPQLQHVQKEAKSAAKLNNMLQDDIDDDDKNSKQKRGVLPKQATQIMKSWLFQHIVHPYPTEDEKRQIASQTNLTLLQVNNWFINARRRILQPMLEASNPDKAKTKKMNKPTNKPQQRFWPIPLDTSANGVAEKSEKEGSGQGLKIKPEVSASTSSASSASSSASSAQKVGLERLQPVVTMETAAVSQSDAMMGYLSNGGLVLKISPEGHLVPNTQMALPANPAPLSLESLQALQSSGLVFAPGPAPLPLHLPLGSLPHSAAAGLGLGMTPFPTLAAAAAVSPMSIGGLNFGAPAFSAPLQFANLNAAPIDLSTMSTGGHLQMSAMASATPVPQQMNAASGQVLMSVSLQEAGQEAGMEDGESEPEAGELRVDTRDSRPALDMSKT